MSLKKRESWYRCRGFSSTGLYVRPTAGYNEHTAPLLLVEGQEKGTHIKPSALPVNTIAPSLSHPTVHTASE